MITFVAYGLLGLIVTVATEDQCANISDTKGCTINKTLSDSRGWIFNTMYPVSNVTSYCEMWHIFVSQGQILTISFEDLDVSVTGSTCDDTYVAIGPSPCTKLCGARYPLSYLSSSSDVWIKYVYRETEGPLRRGFKLTYLIGTIPPSEPCSNYGMPQCRYGQCILPQWVCNGIPECEDSSDERACLSTVPTRTPPNSYSCGFGNFGCFESVTGVYRCYRDRYKCDGFSQCADSSDEHGCNALKRPCQQHWLTDSSGWIASPMISGCSSSNCHSCQSVICIPEKRRVQLRFRTLSTLGYSDATYVDIHDGMTSGDKLIKRMQNDGDSPVEYTPIESSENCVFISFHSESASTTPGFNATYQPKGSCLPNQYSCPMNEQDCYEGSQRCDDIWDCPLYGGDELSCSNCNNRYTCGLTSGRCYSSRERCDGIAQCLSSVDELHCMAERCGHHNGTFLCTSGFCIQESLVCDGNGDCDDHSDELNCPLPAKVILAAVVGSLCCGLLLVISLGLTRRFYVLRMSGSNCRTSRHQSPVTAIEEHIFAQRSAPPLYSEAIATSRPYEEYQREILERHQQQQPESNGAIQPTYLVEPIVTIENNGSTYPILGGVDDDEDLIDVGPSCDVNFSSPSSLADASSTPDCLARWQRRLPKDQSAENDVDGVCTAESFIDVDITSDTTALVSDEPRASASENRLLMTC